MQPELKPSIAAGLACLALAAAPDALQAQLAYDPQAIMAGELWRLWTAHVVHFSWQHAVSDALVLFVATALAERLVPARMVWTALALGAPLIALALLYTAPGMVEYRGASGLAVMMAVLCGALEWRGASGGGRLVLAALGCGLAAKVVAEAFGLSIGLAGLPQDVAVAWQAHLVGALCAAALAHSPHAWGWNTYN